MTPTPHNFAGPVKLPAAWQSRLGRWFRSALALADRSCAKELAFPVTSEFKAVEQVDPGELLARLANGAVGFRLLVGSDQFPSILVFPRPLLLALNGGFLGDIPETMPTDRDLTVVEQSLTEHFLIAHWLPGFKTTWLGPSHAYFQQGPAEPLAQSGRVLAADKEAVAFSWTVSGPFGESTAHWMFRRKNFSAPFGLEDEAVAPASESVPMESLVHGLPVELIVDLGSIELPLSRLSQLQVGDVIMLNRRIDEPIVAQVGDTPKFLGWAGRAGS
ncbi:MAG TPA: FliM/FliN family flagellar motor switch protein, partial [Gemmataceae bacterium]|nr:FliM/FliN family flagellar motor switch protein [Gemmataceae bacterium]